MSVLVREPRAPPPSSNLNPTLSSGVLGKRKLVERPTARGSLAQYIVVKPASRTSPADGTSCSEYESDAGSYESDDTLSDAEESTKAVQTPLLPHSKSYPCLHKGCTKVYTKPSRLTEHERAHTGQRPFVCSVCSKSYLRENHLQAHSRSHLPESARPFICTHENPKCTNRFWTKQHLEAHEKSVHAGLKAYTCTAADCIESFSRKHQLRTHFASAHCAPGTKSFRCDINGCGASFETNQRLRTHGKVHQENRYACSIGSCLHPSSSPSLSSSSSPSTPLLIPTFFPNWSALRAHIGSAHPPACPHAECQGRTFTSREGLKKHLQIHEQKEVEDSVAHSFLRPDEGAYDNDSDTAERVTKRRRGGEIGRSWVCDVEDNDKECRKAFKSKKALTNHQNITHGGLRRFICPYTSEGCTKRFGYKHVMQRHIARKHQAASSSSPSASSDLPPPSISSALPETQPASIRSLLTGEHYNELKSIAPDANRKNGRNRRTRNIVCPWKELRSDPSVMSMLSNNLREGVEPSVSALDTSSRDCAFKFSRVYDLERHLRTEHGLDVNPDALESWLRERDARK